MALRTCRNCGLEAHRKLDLTLFKKHKRMKHGHDTICLDCSHKDVKEWKKENPDLAYQARLRWRAKNPEKARSYRLHSRDTRKREKILASLGPPFWCHFCGQEIEERPVALHSLDRNHDNWKKDNKVPTHMNCHGSHHRQEQLNG